MTIKIYPIANNYFNVESFNDFLKDNILKWKQDSNLADAEKITEIAARICYMSFKVEHNKTATTDFLKKLILVGHESVLEHVNWTFIISGVSRAFTHQLVRHRVGFSFSQLSQQYHEQFDTEFIIPNLIAQDEQLNEQWHQCVNRLFEEYKNILTILKNQSDATDKETKRGILSAARSILPNATETKILITANARALRHFLKLRGALESDEEMRKISIKLYQFLKDQAPSLFFDFEIQTLPDGTEIVQHLI